MAGKASPVTYLPESNPEAIEANRLYQDAQKKLNESLDIRKNRGFDPMWLAAAQGFLSPGKTGSFYESLGRVAGGVGEAQEAERKLAQEEAAARMQVASSGLELQRQKERIRALERMYPPGGMPGGMPGATFVSPAAPAAPAAGLPAPAAGGLPGPVVPPARGGLSAPPGFEGVQGIQTMPANPEMITGAQYVQLGMLGNKPVEELAKEAQEIDQKRFMAKEGGIQDVRTGIFYPFPKGELTERQIDGKTYKVDAKTAALLDLYSSTNDPRYDEVADRVLRGPRRGASEERRGPVSVEEQAAEQKGAEARATKLAQQAAEREGGMKETASTARRIYGTAGRIQNYLSQSGDYFGIFSRPGVVNAIGQIISQGVQTPGGSINLPGLQQAVTQALPGVKQKDLDNIQKAAADLAELELLFTRMYLSGQGAVTEGERRIVGRIPGGISNSPEVLRTRMSLLKERSQFDMDMAQAWKDFSRSNPGKSIMDFEKTSTYQKIETDFEERLAKLEDRLPAVPTSRREASQGNSAARDTLKRLMGGQ